MCIVTKHRKTSSYNQYSPGITALVIFLLFYLSIDLIRQLKANSHIFHFFPMELAINIINLPNRMTAPRILNSLPRTRVSTVNMKPSMPLHGLTIMTNLEHLIIIPGFIIPNPYTRFVSGCSKLGNFWDFQTGDSTKKIFVYYNMNQPITSKIQERSYLLNKVSQF